MAAIHIGRLSAQVGPPGTVAIKRLHPQFSKDPEFVRMFLDEARLAARIHHPNVVSPIDVVSTDGELFIVMDYVRGESLSRLARSERDAGARIPLGIARSILSGVLHGLHAAHEATGERGEKLGMVHRDVSPQNVLVGLDGRSRVVDFGIAKAVGNSSTTREGQIKGKISYMAPECFQAGAVTRKADIYSAAVVLWETLTGEQLFKGETDSLTLARVLSGQVLPPSRFAAEISSELDAVVQRGLSRDPSRRFETAREMALALKATGRLAAAMEVGQWVDRTARAALAARARIVAKVERAGDLDAPFEAPPFSAGEPTPSQVRDVPTIRRVPSDGERRNEVTVADTPPRARASGSLRTREARGPSAARDRCRLVMFSRDDGEYQRLLRDEFVQAARTHGFPARVLSADNDSDKQVAQIHECLREPSERRPTVVMVSPVREVTLLSMADEATRLGVGWVVLSRSWDYVSRLHAQFRELPIFAVVADQNEIGRIQGRQFMALLPRGGELVYIQGPLGTSSAARRFVGVQEVLEGSAIKVFTLHSDWTLEGGAVAMLDWARVFQKRELPTFIVGGQNDAMAMGARQALERLASEQSNVSLGAVSFCGCDGSPSYGQRLVTEGKLAATVIMPLCAGRAVSEVAAMLRGGPRTPATVLLKPEPFPEPRLLSRQTRGLTSSTTA